MRRVDVRALRLLAGFEARADEIAEEIAAASVAEVPGFGSARSAAVHDEIRTLARRHLDAFLHAARTGGPPSPEVLAAARERAVDRAREMVPLAALLHSYLIAQRVISAAIAAEAGPDARSRGAALELTARTFDYNIATTAAMADAYVEAVQGDLAELEAGRRELVDALLRAGSQPGPELTRRAIGLGLDPTHSHVVVLAVIDRSDNDRAEVGSQRWVAEAMAQASGRPRRNAFVVVRNRVVIAVLDANGPHDARAVLDRAGAAVSQAGRGLLRAGIGTPFTGTGGFGTSYHEARRALRHTTARKPVVASPHDVGIFDELLASSDETLAELVPDAIRQALADPVVRATLHAFVEADLNVAATASSMSLHPNSLRYRLRRITELTGRDPRKIADLMELIAATQVLTRQNGHDA
jgi:hypothetical protein